MKTIHINIWDDYYEDDYIPEGEKQETYIYVENSDLSHDKQRECLQYLLDWMIVNVKLEGVKMWLFFYVSKDKYPNLVGTEHEWCLFDRWEIRIENLTHERRYELVEELEKADLHDDVIPFEIDSSS